MLPTPKRNERPYCFDCAERPRTLKKAVHRAQSASAREAKNEPATAALERIADQHGRNGKYAERSKSIHQGRSASLAISSIVQTDGADYRRAVRSVAGAHLAEVRHKIAGLKRIERALAGMIESCEATGRATPCPIIAALAGKTRS